MLDTMGLAIAALSPPTPLGRLMRDVPGVPCFSLEEGLRQEL